MADCAIAKPTAPAGEADALEARWHRLPDTIGPARVQMSAELLLALVVHDREKTGRARRWLPEHVMSDEPFYAPHRPPAPPRQPKPGELLFRVRPRVRSGADVLRAAVSR